MLVQLLFQLKKNYKVMRGNFIISVSSTQPKTQLAFNELLKKKKRGYDFQSLFTHQINMFKNNTVN